MAVTGLSAITLATSDMRASVAFYRALGFEVAHGGPEASFTTFGAGPDAYLNLVLSERPVRWWGRAIFWVDDVDATYRQALEAGLRPQSEPVDATWDERYFHITDPAGHEISIARPLGR